MDMQQVIARPPSVANPQTAAIELSIVVPTFNECDNIAELVRRLDVWLADRRWEVLFVDDDSPDGTADVIREIARRDTRVRCLQRVGRRGLSSACVEGMLANAAPYIAVMDADLQHDERLLKPMLDMMKTGDVDIVVGSRYTAGGGIGEWQSSRARMSGIATRLSRLVLHNEVSDPMSGFFMLRRDVLERTVRRLSSIGFKILLDVLASSPVPLRVKEMPYEFRKRFAGESKLDSQAVWEYLMLLADKLVGHVVPVRFLAFTAIGALGVVAHLIVLTLLFSVWQLPFIVSQALATLVAMTGNFALNNALTYRDRRLKGWRLVKGWLSFSLVCGTGALANVGVASYLFGRDTAWVLAALAGILVGAVWNYAVTSTYTWKSQGTR